MPDAGQWYVRRCRRSVMPPPMSDIVVRRLLIDLDTPPARHWCGGDAFRTAWFNALSMSFPSGEQFFIDAVRAGVQALPEAERARFEPAVKGFIGQEATHRRIHALFNAHLAAQGLVNRWEPRALRRIRAARRRRPAHRRRSHRSHRAHHRDPGRVPVVRSERRCRVPSRGGSRCGGGTPAKKPNTARPRSTSIGPWTATRSGACGCSAW